MSEIKLEDPLFDAGVDMVREHSIWSTNVDPYEIVIIYLIDLYALCYLDHQERKMIIIPQGTRKFSDQIARLIMAMDRDGYNIPDLLYRLESMSVDKGKKVFIMEIENCESCPAKPICPKFRERAGRN